MKPQGGSVQTARLTIREAMKDIYKTKGQLIKELNELRQRLAESNTPKNRHERDEARVERLNTLLRTRSNINQLILKKRTRDRLLTASCRKLIENLGYYNAWIALLDDSGKLVKSAKAGLGKAFEPMLRRLEQGKLTACGRKALKKNSILTIEDPISACCDCPLSNLYAGRAAMVRRLEYSGKTYGLLVVSIPRKFINDEEEQALFEEIAADLAYALNSLETEEERIQAEKALRQREKELSVKTTNLEEVNTALKVLLKRRDEVRTELEEKVVFNVKELVEPFMEKLKKSRLEPNQIAYLSILETNLRDIISPFSYRLSSKHFNLTPTELKIANLVRQGKTTKEIADLLNLSRRTIESHRDHIRKKIGIKNKKINLRTNLMAID